MLRHSMVTFLLMDATDDGVPTTLFVQLGGDLEPLLRRHRRRRFPVSAKQLTIVIGSRSPAHSTLTFTVSWKAP